MKTTSMPGIYLHIPFCKQACHYCNFHFSTTLNLQADFIAALLKEIELKKDYLNGDNITSVYFGGGTPSLLSASQINHIIEQLAKYHTLNKDAEITLEANPDDLNKNYLIDLKATPINRLSIGIQSFHDKDLQYMNRAHNAEEAKKCIDLAQAAGFNNLSIDLIYGTPGMDQQQWLANIKQTLSYNMPHISAYCLTIEPKTAFGNWFEKKEIAPINEDKANQQYEILINELNNNGYEQYEISNFCLPGNEAKHNSSYWKGIPYLGLGPSAHSFNGNSRTWNISNNAKYIKSINEGADFFETEKLSKPMQYNEYIMTALRTKWGISLDKIQQKFGTDFSKHLNQASSKHIKSGHIDSINDTFTLSMKGKHIANQIISDLFVEY